MLGFQMRIENVCGWHPALAQRVEQFPDQRGLAGASFAGEKNDSFARSNPILDRLPSCLYPGSHEEIAWIGAHREGIFLKAEETKKFNVGISAHDTLILIHSHVDYDRKMLGQCAL